MPNANLVNEMITSISEAYSINHTKMFPLHSLWINSHKRKYIVGNQVVIENGVLINSLYDNEVPTHEITLLEGTLADNKHSITLVDLSTNEPLKIDL